MFVLVVSNAWFTRTMDYISSRRSGAVYVRKHHLIDVFPDDIQNKVYLLRHFEDYMLERLYGQHDFCYTDDTKTKNMEFVQKYFRMKNVIVFKLSHDVLQVTILFSICQTCVYLCSLLAVQFL